MALTDAQRAANRRAQRKLARDLKTGQFKPSTAGKQARKAANTLEALRNPEQHPGFKVEKDVRLSENDKHNLYVKTVQRMFLILDDEEVPQWVSDIAGGHPIHTTSALKIQDNVSKMSIKEMFWTVNASDEQIKEAARTGRGGGLWFYH